MVVGIIALYQDWVPFLLAIGYVVLHHGVVGVWRPADVYNHSAAWAHPWLWAGVHGAFIAAMSVVLLIAWRLNERTSARSELILKSYTPADADTAAKLGRLLELSDVPA